MSSPHWLRMKLIHYLIELGDVFDKWVTNLTSLSCQNVFWIHSRGFLVTILSWILSTKLCLLYVRCVTYCKNMMGRIYGDWFSVLKYSQTGWNFYFYERKECQQRAKLKFEMCGRNLIGNQVFRWNYFPGSLYSYVQEPELLLIGQTQPFEKKPISSTFLLENF